MKKVYVVLMVTCFLFSCGFSDRHEVFSDSDQKINVLLPIEKNDDEVTFWSEQINFNNRLFRNKVVGSMKTKFNIDCANNKATFLFISIYDKHGNVISSGEENTTQEIIPDTMLASVKDYVCK